MTNDELRQELKKEVRNLGFLNVDIDVNKEKINVSSFEFTALDDNIVEYSMLNTMGGEEARVNVATLEPNFWVLDGSLELYDDNDWSSLRQKYISNTLSNSSCVYENDIPCLVMENNSAYTQTPIEGMNFTFDSIGNEYPTEIELKIYNGATLLLDKICDDIDNYEYNAVFTNEEEITGFTKVEIYLNKSLHPNRRARLMRVGFGYHLKYTSEEITNAETEEKLIPINSELPTKQLKFTVENINNYYDIDNPEGVYEHLIDAYDLKYSWGYQLDDGSIVWTDEKKLKTTGEISVEGNEVTFTAVSGLELMTDTNTTDTEMSYSGGNIQSRTLYELVTDLLPYNNLFGDITDLQNIKTTASLPAEPINEVLQLIATAGCKALVTNNNGDIGIKEIKNEIADDEWDYDFILSNPSIETQPLLRSISIPVYSFQPSSEEEELVRRTIGTVSARTAILLGVSHEPAVDVSAIIENKPASISFSITDYGDGADLSVYNSADNAVNVGEIVFSGKKYVRHERIMTRQYNNEGEDIEYQNDLITETLVSDLETLGYDLCDFIADWYQNKLIYSLENRGDIITSTGANINIETQFSESVYGYLLENNISYNGAWKGNSVFVKTPEPYPTEYEILGDTSQNGEPTLDNPVPVETKTGNIVEIINEKEYSFNLGDLELCKIGPHQDKIYKGDGKWRLYKKVDKKILNGDENWSYYYGASTSTDNFCIFRLSVSNGSLYYFSNKFLRGRTYMGNNRLYLQTGYLFLSLNNDVTGISSSDHTSQRRQKLKNWLSQNNIILYYTIDTPTDTVITDTNLLRQLDFKKGM